jgi:DNA-binding transcriptional LysR family regulator
VRGRLRQKLESARARLEVVLEIDQLEAMLSLVASGLGVSIAPEYVTRANDRVCAIPLEPKAHGGIKAIWDGDRPSEIVSQFLRALLGNAARVR